MEKTQTLSVKNLHAKSFDKNFLTNYMILNDFTFTDLTIWMPLGTLGVFWDATKNLFLSAIIASRFYQLCFIVIPSKNLVKLILSNMTNHLLNKKSFVLKNKKSRWDSREPRTIKKFWNCDTSISAHSPRGFCLLWYVKSYNEAGLSFSPPVDRLESSKSWLTAQHVSRLVLILGHHAHKRCTCTLGD